MADIIDFSTKRKERISKISSTYILNKYWNKNIPVDIIDILNEMKEISLKVSLFDTSIDKEFHNFFASVSKEGENYILYYRKGMEEKYINICCCFAISYITNGMLEKESAIYIDKRIIFSMDLAKREHELKALKFTGEILMPLDAVMKTLEILENKKEECTIGNIARYMNIPSAYIAMQRLSELKFLGRD